MPSPKLRVLFVGPLFKGSTALMRLMAFRKLGAVASQVDTEELFPGGRHLLISCQRRLAFGPRVSALNRAILTAAREMEPELVWFDKALLVWPRTVQELKNTAARPTIVHYSPDDQMNPQNQSRHYLRSIPSFHAHITTKMLNVAELQSLGAKNVFFQPPCFCDSTHRKLDLSPEDLRTYGADISFVGAYEKSRANSIAHLGAAGLVVTVWGPGWKGFSAQNVTVKNRAVWDDEYVRILNASKINLCFLRKVNRDVMTSRTFEIPACGGFMLAERTAEQMGFFSDGTEAAYFSSDHELLERARYFLADSESRRVIAAAGHNKCISTGNSYRDRLGSFLELFQELRQ